MHAQTPVVYLTVDQVIELHTLAMEFGGIDGVRSEHDLASAVMQPQQTVFGEDAYPTTAEKAAAYAYFIVMNHPFLDGNKRTGLLALETFLEVNGYMLVEDEDDTAQMFEDLAASVIGKGEFFGWVVNHTKPDSQRNVISFTAS